MKRSQFVPYGLITLLSTFLFILIFFITSLLWLDVHRTQRSIEVSFENLRAHYELERQLTVSIHSIEADLLQSVQNQQSFEDWINKAHPLDLNVKALDQSITFTQTYQQQSVQVTLLIDTQSMSVLRILEKAYRNGIDQDYSQNGDPVYGGTP